MPLRLPSRLRERLERLMLRVRPPELLPIVLPQRRIYVLPTGVGFSYGCLLLAMLLASLNYTLSLGFALTFVLVGVGHLALLGAHRNLLGVTVTDGRTEAVFSGEPVELQLFFEEASNRIRASLTISAHKGSRVNFSIPAGGRTSARVELPPMRRGCYRPGRLRLETRYPLGLIRAWSYIEPDIRFWVYPEPEVAPPPYPCACGDNRNRGRTDSGSDSFDSLRPYRPGDPLRRIAWRRLAAGGPPVTKEFRSDTEGKRVFRWEHCGDLDTEARLSRLCAWILLAHQDNEHWGLALPGLMIPLGAGAAQLQSSLEALAEFGMTDV